MNYDRVQLLKLANAANLESVRLLCEQVEAALQTLNDRERRVLELRFGLEDGRGRILQQIADDFNVTRERIRQIEAKGLRKLRQAIDVPAPSVKASSPPVEVPHAALDGGVPIEKLGLGKRVLYCLKRGGIKTVEGVLSRNEWELLAIQNFGPKSLEELRERLRVGGYLPSEEAPPTGHNSASR